MKKRKIETSATFQKGVQANVPYISEQLSTYGAEVYTLKAGSYDDGSNFTVVEVITPKVDPRDTIPERPKVVYIAHPISGHIALNLDRISDIARTLNLSGENIVPFAPYFLDVHCLDDDDPAERARGIQNDTYWLMSGAIDEVWLYGDRISNGMLAEVKLAESLGIPVVPKTLETTKALNEYHRSK